MKNKTNALVHYSTATSRSFFDCAIRSHTSTVSFHNEFGKTIENTYNFHEQKYFRPLKNKIKWSTSKKTELKILLRRVVVIFLFIRWVACGSPSVNYVVEWLTLKILHTTTTPTQRRTWKRVWQAGATCSSFLIICPFPWKNHKFEHFTMAIAR